MPGEQPPVRVTDDERPGWKRVVLAGRVTVAGAREFHATARALAADAAGVAVRCDEVEYLDTSAIQILLCLGREVVRAGRPFVVSGVPDGLAESLRLAGLAGSIGP